MLYAGYCCVILHCILHTLKVTCIPFILFILISPCICIKVEAVLCHESLRLDLCQLNDPGCIYDLHRSRNPT